MTVAGKIFAERKEAGRALMKEILTLVQLQHEGENVIASIGGFDLEYEGERFGKDGYRYTTMLMRTGADYEMELSMTVTPLGAVSRLEHALTISRVSGSAFPNVLPMPGADVRRTSPGTTARNSPSRGPGREASATSRGREGARRGYRRHTGSDLKGSVEATTRCRWLAGQVTRLSGRTRPTSVPSSASSPHRDYPAMVLTRPAILLRKASETIWAKQWSGRTLRRWRRNVTRVCEG